MAGREPHQTQCDRLLRHFREYEGITQLEALNEYGIMRLASRIYDLERMGYTFKRTWQHRTDRYGEKVSFLRYSLEEEK